MNESAMPLEVLPHPFKKDHRIVLWAMERDTSADFGEKPMFTMVMTTASEDRHGSVFNPDGWDFGPYLRNPVVLWSHMTKIPLVGTAQNLVRDGDKWRSTIELAVDEWAAGGGFNLAAVLARMLAKNKLRAMSHGFMPREWVDRPATMMPRMFAENVEYKRQELMEQSFVNVPSNREAVRSAVSEGIISGNEADVLASFGFSLHADAPTEIRISEPATKPADRSFALIRREVTHALRCCGPYADPCCGQPETEPVTAEDQAIEIQTATDLTGEYLAVLATALDGWKSAEHDELRAVCSSAVYSAMWTIERLTDLVEYWYGIDIEIDVPDNVTADDLQAYGMAAAKDPATRAGAVFSAKNKSAIQQIADLAQQLLEAAKTAEQEEAAENEDDASRGVSKLNVSFTLDDLSRAIQLRTQIGGSPSGSGAQAPTSNADGSTPAESAAPEPKRPPALRVMLDSEDLRRKLAK